MSENNTQNSNGTTDSGQGSSSNSNQSSSQNNQPTAKQMSEADIDKIVNSRIADVEKNVNKKVVGQIVKSLSGEKDDPDPIKEKLIENPTEFFQGLAKTVHDKAVKTVTDGIAVQEAVKTAFNGMSEEYPQLSNVKNEVFAEFSNNTDVNKSEAERIKIASENVAKRMGWKKKSEAANDKDIKDSGMIPSGIYRSENPALKPVVDKMNESTSNFMASRKKQFLERTGQVK